jgi:hypothetical protein
VSTLHRVAPGTYEVTEGGRTVVITRETRLPRSGGQWTAYAEWDRLTVMDPRATLSAALQWANAVLAES